MLKRRAIIFIDILWVEILQNLKKNGRFSSKKESN